MISKPLTIHSPFFKSLFLTLGQHLFANGWGFFIPYLVGYVIFERTQLRVDDLYYIFIIIHLFNILSFAAYIYYSPKKAAWSDVIFWTGLTLLFLIPGAYLEFPSDAWEHFRRIYSWTALELVHRSPYSHKFTYFWGWTLLSKIWDPSYRRLGLNLYSTFWQLLLAYQFFLFFKKLGFTSLWAKVQVLGTLLFFGTYLFSFYRYYALSSTILSYMAYLQILILIIGIVDENKPSLQFSIFKAFLDRRIVWLGILLLFIVYNHTQSMIFVVISTAALVFDRCLEIRHRLTLTLLGVVTGLFLLLGYIVAQYPKLILWPKWHPKSDYISALSTFRLWDTNLSYFETIGVHGVISIIFAIILVKKYRRVAILTLAPYYAMLFPPFVVYFSTHHGQATNWITYRALFAFPTSVMIVLGAKEIISIMKDYFRLPLTEFRIAALVTLCLVVLAWSPAYPFRGKFFFLIYRPPDELSLLNLDPIVRNFGDDQSHQLDCLLFGDHATQFLMATHYDLTPQARLLPFNMTDMIVDENQLQTLLKLEKKCGLLVTSSQIPDIPDSVIGAVSGHWSPSSVRENLRYNRNFDSVLTDLENSGWTKIPIPPFYQLLVPDHQLPPLSTVEYFTHVADLRNLEGGEIQVLGVDFLVDPITTQSPIGQTFHATKDNLAGIGLLLTTYHRQNNGTVSFHLQEAEKIGTQEFLGSVEVAAAKIQDNQWFTVVFPPISNSKGQEYYILVESDSADPLNAIAAWVKKGNPYRTGYLNQAGQPIDGDLSFGLLYQEPD